MTGEDLVAKKSRSVTVCLKTSIFSVRALRKHTSDQGTVSFALKFPFGVVFESWELSTSSSTVGFMAGGELGNGETEDRQLLRAKSSASQDDALPT